ncbi:MAG TPA: DASS family sodium-coupled anion symporter [Vicinamibacterales bacterium]|nr:DASS family sodium-coupled anion symporter [Vicinamibacterales bacterium]
MRRLHEAAGAVEVYSPAEERFNRRRRTAGLAAAPVLFVLLLWLLPDTLAGPARRLGAVLGAMIVLWMTEALPLAVTALLGPVLAILLGIAPAREAFAPFADPIIFLFIGSFMLAEAMFRHGLDRRIAFTALASRLVQGGSAVRLVLVYSGVTAAISMWISNTATTAMMYPIGLSIVGHLAGDRLGQPEMRRFAAVMMLATAFAASIGGMATPVGTPPNLIGLAMLERLAGVRLSFVEWMALGVPLAAGLVMLLVAWFAYADLRHVGLRSGGREAMAEELARLGPLGPGERNVLVAFGITVTLWVIPGLFAVVGAADSAAARAYAAAVPEAVAALIGAILLFLLPVNWRARRFTLSWDEAAGIDWGIILVFGGGLAMGELAFETGLARALGDAVAGWLPGHGSLALTVAFTGLAIALSETASNTASANVVVPVAIAVAQASGVDPLRPALGATLGASMGFMMPISTPPNAIVYSSGYVPITTMMRHGIVLDVVGFVLIVTLLALVPLG